MNLNISYDATTLSTAPSGFFSAVNYVVNLFNATFTANVTVNIQIGYGTFPYDNSAVPALGESMQNNLAFVNYGQAARQLVAEGAPGAEQHPRRVGRHRLERDPQSADRWLLELQPDCHPGIQPVLHRRHARARDHRGYGAHLLPQCSWRIWCLGFVSLCRRRRAPDRDRGCVLFLRKRWRHKP